MQLCEDCRFWDSSTSHTSDESMSACRVNPPMVDFHTGQGIWPFTNAEDWCGRFEQAEP